MDLLQKTLDSIEKSDRDIMDQCQEKLDGLLKPQGSLGKLEYIAKKLSGITGKINNTFNKKNIIIMGGDNGVIDEGVSSFPQKVSMLVADTMIKGMAGVSVLAKHAGANLTVVDLGLKEDLPESAIINRKIKYGTGNIAKESAMSVEEAIKAIETGIEITDNLVKEGVNLLGTGEIGICNTTTSSAVLACLSGDDVDSLVGRGAGLTDEGLENKKAVIKRAIEVNKPDPDNVIDVLAKVGGFDIAGLVGAYLGAAAAKTPIVIDGFISGVAALAAFKLKPEVLDYMFASHLSVEPGALKIHEILNLEPMLNMDMRLGEGTGCALAFNIIEAATEIMNNMGTFADIGM